MAIAQTKVIPLDKIQDVLNQRFKFKRLTGQDHCKGYFVKIERCPLPIQTENTEYSGADVLAMLAKLTEWEKAISECREGLFEILENQIAGLK